MFQESIDTLQAGDMSSAAKLTGYVTGNNATTGSVCGVIPVNVKEAKVNETPNGKAPDHGE